MEEEDKESGPKDTCSGVMCRFRQRFFRGFFSEHPRPPDTDLIKGQKRTCQQELVDRVRGRCQNRSRHKGQEYCVLTVLLEETVKGS